MNVNQYMACISHDSEDVKKNTVRSLRARRDRENRFKCCLYIGSKFLTP